ncbi:MAG: flagellar basal body protein, partial [Paeniglutamicibacter sp.]
MLRSLYSGISGLRAHQTMLDTTGNNIANVNTAGFKSSSVQFQDTLSQMTQGATTPGAD